MNEIFGNVELIFSLNNELLRELSQRVWEWDDATTCLGDIFLKVVRSCPIVFSTCWRP